MPVSAMFNPDYADAGFMTYKLTAMRVYAHLIFTFLMITSMIHGMAQSTSKLKWNKLPSIPNSVGFAGSFAGVSNGALLVAGGANFPDGGAPWTGSAKVWHDDIYVLTNADGKWAGAGKLAHPLGYGASVNWKNSLIILGGSSEKGHHAEVYQLTYENGRIHSVALPSLPYPIANTSAVLIGNTIYVAGGLKTPDNKTAEQNLWSLDLNETEKSWKILEGLPGAPRMLSVTGTQNGLFYIFSGVSLTDGSRTYLKDAYQYSVKTGWKRIADLPTSVTAAPTPAYASGSTNLLIFGGDDGEMAAQAAILKDKHPGFSNQILNYNTMSDTWTVAGKIPGKPPVTTTLTIWEDNIIIPGGEVRPAIRTPEVLTVKSIVH